MSSPRKAVFTVRQRGEGQKAFWCRVGSAFVNKDGSLSILLDALPLDGKLVVREEVPRDADDARRPRRDAPATTADDFGDEIPF